MARLLAAFALLALLLSGVTGAASGEEPVEIAAPSVAPEQIAPGKIVVKFRPGVIVEERLPTGIPAIDALIGRFSISKLQKLFTRSKLPEKPEKVDLSRIYTITFPAGFDPQQVAEAFSADPNVEYAQVVGIHLVYPTYPNDPRFAEQWALNNTGQTGGTTDCDVDAPEAWGFYHGSSSVRLAIVDSGVDWKHPDLGGTAGNNYTDGNIWINWAEYNGTAGVDDDGNGYIDDIRGWDWVDGVSGWTGEDVNTPDNDPMDFNGHGTHCSGIASAITNNGIGVAGLAWDARIMALRAGWSGKYHGQEVGYVGMDFAAQAIVYATNMGATAINCSWGSSNTGGLGDAVDYAIEHGVLVVVAAGNDGVTTQDYLNGRGDCIDVAATDHNDVKASWSNYGTWVDLSAPGVSILSTYFDHNATGDAQHAYELLSGTSMATPHVVGLIGLVKGYYPGLTASEIRDIIYNSADNISSKNPGYEGLLGSGRINAYSALSTTPVEPRIRYQSHVINDAAGGNGDAKADPGETNINMTVTLTNKGTQAATGVSAALTTADPYITITSSSSSYPDLAPRGGSGDSQTPYVFNVSASCPQGWEVTFTLNISANGGAYTGTDTFVIVVGTPPTKPDLTLSSSDIAFSNDQPAVGEVITITATIHNNGTAYNDIEATAFAQVTSGGTTGYYVDVTQWDAQSFTATSDAYLAKVSIAAWDVGTNTTNPAQYFKVSIQSNAVGKPSGTDLSSIESYDFATSTEWHDFIFSTPARLTNGTKYWIVARSSAPNVNGYAWRYRGTPDAYAGGGAIIDDTTSAEVIWGTESTTEDFWFAAYRYTYNTVVKFFDGDPDAAGTQIGTDQMLPPIAQFGSDTASVNWTAASGSHDIYVVVDPDNLITESDETNNKAYKSLPPPPPTIEITAPATIVGWELTPSGEQPQEKTGTLKVDVTPDSESWTVKATDEDVTTSGKMTQWTGSAYGTTRLATAMDVQGPAATVTLPNGTGTPIASGTGDNFNITITFKQSVLWSDTANLTYCIIVTFTGSITP